MSLRDRIAEMQSRYRVRVLLRPVWTEEESVSIVHELLKDTGVSDGIQRWRRWRNAVRFGFDPSLRAGNSNTLRDEIAAGKRRYKMRRAVDWKTWEHSHGWDNAVRAIEDHQGVLV